MTEIKQVQDRIAYLMRQGLYWKAESLKLVLAEMRARIKT